MYFNGKFYNVEYILKECNKCLNFSNDGTLCLHCGKFWYCENYKYKFDWALNRDACDTGLCLEHISHPNTLDNAKQIKDLR